MSQFSQKEMPRYQSHKKVWALKIKSIVRDGEGENRETDGSAMITPEEEGYAPFRVDHRYMHKHKPQVGGYYVRYEDGYQSFSPAKAFEDGYTLLEKVVRGESVDSGSDISFTMLKGWFVGSDDGDGGTILMADCPNCGDAVVYNDGCIACNANFEFKTTLEIINKTS